MRVPQIMASTSAAAWLLMAVTAIAQPIPSKPDATASDTTSIRSLQVVNTPGNPVPTLDNATNPANVVEIVATAPNGRSGTFALQGPDGNVTPFTTVPSGKTLVITSGDFLAEHLITPLVNIQFGIVQNGAIPSARVWVVSGNMTTVLSWPPGIVIGASQALFIEAFGDDVIVRFRGYLIPE
jgi:hypothetical protein